MKKLKALISDLFGIFKKYWKILLPIIAVILIIIEVKDKIIVPIINNYKNDLKIKDLSVSSSMYLKKDINKENFSLGSNTGRCIKNSINGIDIEFSLYNTNDYEILINSVQIKVDDFKVEDFVPGSQFDRMSETSYCCSLFGTKTNYKCEPHDSEKFTTIKSGNFERIKLKINSLVQGTYNISIKIFYQGHNVNWKNETIIIDEKLYFYDFSTY